MERAQVRSAAGALLKGAIAGAVGVWVMDRVGWFLLNREDEALVAREERARPERLDPAQALAKRVAGAVGRELADEQPRAPATAVHYALGVVPAALYGLGTYGPRTPARGPSPLRALLFGLGVFTVADEAAGPLLGIAGPPGAYPWQAHARGLASHLAFGVVTDTVLALLNRSRRGKGERAFERPAEDDRVQRAEEERAAQRALAAKRAEGETLDRYRVEDVDVATIVPT